jgi:predicted transcriptional regulator
MYLCSMSKEDTLTIRIDPDLKKKLQKLAEKDHRKLSDYIHIILEKATEKK